MNPLLVNDRRHPAAAVASATTPPESDVRGPQAAEQLHAPAESILFARRSILSAPDFPALQTAVAAHLRRSANATLVVWYHPSGSQIGQQERLEGLLCPSGGIAESLKLALKETARHASQSGEPCVQRLQSESDSKFQLVALPVPAFPGQCLLALLETDSPDSGMSAAAWASLLMLSGLINEWALQRNCQLAAEEARTVAALIELVAHVQSAPGSDAACQRLADSLQSLLHADCVYVGLCPRGSKDVRLTAIAGGGTIDPFSEETRLIESVLQETQLRSAGGVWPVRDPNNRHALLSHQQLSESWNDCTIVSAPLQSETGAGTGSIILTFRDAAAAQHAVSAECFLRAGSESLGSCLEILQKLADSRWLQWTQSIRKQLTRSRLELAAWICGAIVVALLIPIDYVVQGSCELQPVARRFVAAPFNGPLLKCLVEPGDVVQKNDLLAVLDGREIRWELAEVQANLHKATKERNTHMSSHEFGDAAIALHEVQRLQQRSELLTHRDSSLEVRSPADGVVVSGDHREAEGVPLETGQTLFEIAPLDAMVIEVCIPEIDIRHVHVGMNVRVQLDAVPEDSLEATIRNIHPRAELRDGSNVFVAEADVVNSSGMLRPGMRGSSKISTGRNLLGWNLFHKPFAYLLGWLGW